MSAEQKQGSKSDGAKQAFFDKASVQVLNVSFPRCGTISMKAALDQLGYNCWHATLCFNDVQQCSRWIAALDGKFSNEAPFAREDWDGIFREYTAISADPPATALAEDLIKAYPNAKVILVERDEDAWFESFTSTIMQNMFRWDLHAVANIDPQLIGPLRDMHWHWVKTWWAVDSKEEMRAKARCMYREHNRVVRAVTPSHRLLEFRLEDGWEPLCTFLNKAVPDTPFPRMHDRGEFEARNQFMVARGLKIIGTALLKMVSVLCVCAFAWWYQRKGPTVA